MQFITATLPGTRAHLYSSMMLIFVIVVFQNSLSAQNKLEDLKGSTSIMGQLWGLEVLGVHLNHNINHSVSINVGVGVLLDAHLGTNIYLSDRTKKKTSFYIGTQIGFINELGWLLTTGETQPVVYLPIGFEYISQKGFTIQVDAGPNFVKNEWIQLNAAPFLFSVKLGHIFRKKS